MQLSQQSFDAVVRLFERASGIRYSADKRTLVAGRLNRLAHEAGAENLDAYVGRLLADAPADEIIRVVDRLTTNETYFFREPQHFELLAERARAHDRRRPMRIWSAACSSGEEAYSAAMVLADTLGAGGWEIVGTDLSQSMVQAARTGLYPMARTEGIGEARLKRHCLKGSGPYDGHLLIGRALRARCRFEQANLLEALPDIGRFDIVFLRNVLIYFDTERKKEIVHAVVQRMAPDALLLIGHAETLTNVTWEVAAVMPAVYERAG